MRREPLVTIDTATDADERDAIVRDLRAIAGLDERPDRTIDRAVAARATLARARALRFRLSLIEGWVAANVAPDSSTDIRSLHLDLSIDAMLIVGFVAVGVIVGLAMALGTRGEKKTVIVTTSASPPSANAAATGSVMTLPTIDMNDDNEADGGK